MTRCWIVNITMLYLITMSHHARKMPFGPSHSSHVREQEHNLETLYSSQNSSPTPVNACPAWTSPFPVTNSFIFPKSMPLSQTPLSLFLHILPGWTGPPPFWPSHSPAMTKPQPERGVCTLELMRKTQVYSQVNLTLQSSCLALPFLPPPCPIKMLFCDMVT